MLPLTSTTIKLVVAIKVIAICIFVPMGLYSQAFTSVTSLNVTAAVKTTGDKPQSKIWKYKDKWYTVFPNSSGTFLWRLEGTTWIPELKISTNTTVKADCKPLENVCHILLWRKETSPSQLVSVEFDSLTSHYRRWTKRTSTVYLTLDAGVEIATIDIDSKGRMWMASDGLYDARIRWSDSPYTSWSEPITLATGIKDDDICGVINMPALGQIGFFWSDQVSKRFGFRIHKDIDDPSVWSTNEIPASQSALNIKSGMADDHFNMKTDREGRLYVAVKTGFDTRGYPRIALLKRQPSGTWDDLYHVADYGTKPMVMLNESTGKLKVFFSFGDHGGDILYAESSMDAPAFETPVVLITGGVYNDPTCTKNNYKDELVVLASGSAQIVGVLAQDPPGEIPPGTPALLAPVNEDSEVDTVIELSWQSVAEASAYHIQVSASADFSSVMLEADSVISPFVLDGLDLRTTYYWRVMASNVYGNSQWSTTWHFSTLSQVPDVPVLISPEHQASSVLTRPVLIWHSSSRAVTYHIQISDIADFSTIRDEVSTRDTTLAQFDTLLSSTTYYWRVRAENAIDFSAWSPVWSITTQDSIIVSLPLAPLLISPADHAISLTTSPTLVWTESSTANDYHVQLSFTSDFNVVERDVSQLSSLSYQLDTLQKGVTYFWRVRSGNDAGNSAWSDVWSFTTQAAVTGLVAHWKMDEGGGIILTDDSGTGNHGIVYGGASWNTGISGLALQQSLSGQYTFVPDAPSLAVTNAVTVAAWVKPEKLASQYLIQKGLATDGYQFSLLSTGKISFQFNQTSSSSLKLNSNGLYPYDGVTWLHVAATYDGSSIRLYINGTLDKTITFSAPMPIAVNQSPLTIGAKNDGASSLRGTLDELRIYNRALTNQEVAQLFTIGATARSAAIAEAAKKYEDDQVSDWALSPNPVSTHLYLTLPEESEDVSLTIIDVRGKLMVKKQVRAENKRIELNLNELDLVKGVYLLIIQSPKSKKVFRFVKN